MGLADGAAWEREFGVETKLHKMEHKPYPSPGPTIAVVMNNPVDVIEARNVEVARHLTELRRIAYMPHRNATGAGSAVTAIQDEISRMNRCWFVWGEF